MRMQYYFQSKFSGENLTTVLKAQESPESWEGWGRRQRAPPATGGRVSTSWNKPGFAQSSLSAVTATGVSSRKSHRRIVFIHRKGMKREQPCCRATDTPTWLRALVLTPGSPHCSGPQSREDRSAACRLSLCWGVLCLQGWTGLRFRGEMGSLLGHFLFAEPSVPPIPAKRMLGHWREDLPL